MSEKIILVRDTEVRIRGRLVRIARIEGDKYEFLDDPESLISQLRTCGSRIDLFTFMERIANAKLKRSYPMEWENVAAVPITTFEDWWERQVDSKTRNMVRKALKKGVEVRTLSFDDELVRGISRIYNETPIRQGRHFRHFGKKVDDVRTEEGTFRDRSVFLGAFFKEAMIGFAKLVRDSHLSQAGLMNILSMVEHRDKAPTNALVAEAVRSCAASGIPYLVYSNFSYGKRQKDSLRDFKQNNGFERFDLPRYYVPLTALGRVTWGLRLHHKWVDHLPEPIVNKGRELRNRWDARGLRATPGVTR